MSRAEVEKVSFARGGGEEFDRLVDALMKLQAPRAVSHIDSIMELVDVIEEVRVTIEASWEDGKTGKPARRPARISARGELSERHVDVLERILAHFQPFGHATWSGDEERDPDDVIGPASISYMPPETMSGHEALEMRSEAQALLIAFLVETGLSLRVAEDLVTGDPAAKDPAGAA